MIEIDPSDPLPRGASFPAPSILIPYIKEAEARERRMRRTRNVLFVCAVVFIAIAVIKDARAQNFVVESGLNTATQATQQSAAVVKNKTVQITSTVSTLDELQRTNPALARLLLDDLERNQRSAK